MNKIAGTIVYKGFLDEAKLDALVYSCFDTALESGNTTLLVFWETKKNMIETQDELKTLWEIISIDLSHSEQDKIMLLNKKIEGDIHESVTFEWIEVAYEWIVDRFAESYEVVAIREAGDSEKYGNKMIKAEFIY